MWVNFLLVLLPLLSENVQAADSYFGNRNWNLRRPIALGSRPNPVVNPIHSIPKPLPAPIEVGSNNDALEIKDGNTLKVEPTGNYVTEQSTIIPNYRLLPQREPLLRARPEPSPEPPTIIATEPTTVEEHLTTSLYTNLPEVTASDDIQVLPTRRPSTNPAFRRPMVPRPLPRPGRIELIRPNSEVSELTTTTAPTTVPIVENWTEINPSATIIIIDPKTEAPTTTSLPETQSTPAALPTPELELDPEPKHPEIEMLKNAPEEDSELLEVEEKLEIVLPENFEANLSEDVVVQKQDTGSRPESSYVAPPRPLVFARRPVIRTHPYRVPKPIVSSPRPILPKVVVTTLKPTTPQMREAKPVHKSLLPSDSGSVWTTPAPTELLDYKCTQPDAYYRIAGDCDNYVECRKYKAVMYTCPDGLHFNPRARWPEYPCAYPSEVKCESNSVRQLAHPTDKCPQQYGFYPIDSDCSRYIMCQEGIAFVMNCPPGLAFSSASSSCDWPENVPSCKPDVFHGFTCPAPPLEEDGSPSEFIFKYRFKESCKEYIACQRGHPRLLRCDDGLSFDEESEVCVDSDYVSNCRY